MTQLLAVETDFRDIEQMAQGLEGRVHATHLILPTAEAVDEGEWAKFQITLFDGSAGLSGLGRCVTVVDNGEERDAHQRYDIVFDSLQFDDHEQGVFEHVLSLHGAGAGEVEQIDASEAQSVPPVSFEDTGSFVDVSAEFTGSISVSGSELQPVRAQTQGRSILEEEDDNTQISSADALRAAYTVSDSMLAPAGDGVEASAKAAPAVRISEAAYHGGATAHALSASAQPVVHADELEEPRSGERIAPAHRVASAFSYPSGIPFPAQPPRPELEPGLRVTAAPRPASLARH